MGLEFLILQRGLESVDWCSKVALIVKMETLDLHPGWALIALKTQIFTVYIIIRSDNNNTLSCQ